MVFRVDQTVFYAGHGIAKITEVIEKNVGGGLVKLYKLAFVHKDMTVLLPFNSMKTSGVRSVSGEELVSEAYAELSRRPERERSAFDLAPAGWGRRQREYQMKIQGGDLIEMIGVYRDIMLLSFKKELSFGEKTILATLEDLVSQDISCGASCSRESVVAKLRKPFSSLAEELFGEEMKGSDEVGPVAQQTA